MQINGAIKVYAILILMLLFLPSSCHGNYSQEKLSANITNDEFIQSYASFSPDGLKIVYSSNEDGGVHFDIWVMNSDGTNKIQLTDNELNQTKPIFSPNGKNIVYVSESGFFEEKIGYINPYNSLSTDFFNKEIWVMNSDGSNKKLLTPGEYSYDWPNFSPDGTQIVYVSTEANNRNSYHIWMMDVSGEHKTEIIVPEDEMINFMHCQVPSFNINGNKIIFETVLWKTYPLGGGQQGPISDIWQLDITNGELQKITDRRTHEKHPRYDNIGNVIYAFFNTTEKPYYQGIALMTESAGKETVLIRSLDNVSYPNFSPDGKKIVYVEDGDIWIYNVDMSDSNLNQPQSFDQAILSDVLPVIIVFGLVFLAVGIWYKKIKKDKKVC